MRRLDEFRRVIALDTEYEPVPGGVQRPICVGWRDIRSGDSGALWTYDERPDPPFPIDEDTLFVVHYGTAEWRTFLALGWPLPTNVYDTWVVEKRRHNGDVMPRLKLTELTRRYGFEPPLDDDAKKCLQLRCAEGGPFTATERDAILDYVMDDVTMTANVFGAQSPLSSPWALFHSAYMVDTAKMEHAGIPVDVERYTALIDRWDEVREALIERERDRFPVFEGTEFREHLFQRFLVRHDLPWPYITGSDRLCLDTETFRDAARVNPTMWPLYYLRKDLGTVRSFELPIGPDKRHRPFPHVLPDERRRLWGLGPFHTRTTRHQTSTSESLWQLSAWLRSIMVAPPGRAIAVVDYAQQEFLIGAVVSGDEAMRQAYYASPYDPYLAFGKLCGIIPALGTKASHPAERATCKTVVLALQYGMGWRTLQLRLNQSTRRGDSRVFTDVDARAWVRRHQHAFPAYWSYLDRIIDQAKLAGELVSPHGWRINGNALTADGEPLRPTQYFNWPIQTRGAEILRAAIMLCHRVGVTVLTGVHDALVIECDADDIEEAVHLTRACMQEASELVLGRGNWLRTDSFEALKADGKILMPGERYRDRRAADGDPEGKDMWDRAGEVLGWVD